MSMNPIEQAYVEVSGRRVAKLDTNENLFVPRSFLADVARRALDLVDFRLYPTRRQLDEVAGRLSDYLGVDRECIVIGSGADQLIDLLITLFGGEGVLTFKPTFTFYEWRCRVHGARLAEIPLRSDLSFDEEALEGGLERAGMVIICSPNNPTGHSFPREFVEGLASGFDGVIVVDETYGEFSDETMHDLPMRYENIIVLRSLSKSFASASIRLGYLVAARELAEEIWAAQYPYPVTGFSLAYASILLEKVDYFKEVWREVKAVRRWFSAEMEKVNSAPPLPSNANFVAVLVDVDPERLREALIQRGYSIRTFGGVMGFRCLARITLAPRPVLEDFPGCFAETLGEVI